MDMPDAPRFPCNPVISADGRYVAYDSWGSWVAADTAQVSDVYIYDRLTRQTQRVSIDSSGDQAQLPSSAPAVSGNGRFVAFWSLADTLVAGDASGFGDVFVHHRSTRQTTRVSVNSAGNEANGPTSDLAIAASGRYVAFRSLADNFVPGDTNEREHLFVHDRITRQTTRVNVTSAGRQVYGPDLGSDDPVRKLAISADGRFVAFCSRSAGLIPNDSNRQVDVFMRDRETGKTTLVSNDTGGKDPRAGSWSRAISADGRYIAFESALPAQAGRDRGFALFIHDRLTRENQVANVDASGLLQRYENWSTL